MAPEAYRDELCTEKIDIYSLAMLTWEMLTGQVHLSKKISGILNHLTWPSAFKLKKTAFSSFPGKDRIFRT